MKKKLISFLLACAMTLSLAACGGTEAPKPAETKPASDGNAAQTEAAAPEGFTTSTWKPSSTVNIVVPAGAGGGTDLCARVFAQYAKKITGVDFVVINSGGAAGSVAANQVLSAKNDGNTVLFGHNLVNVACVAKVTDYDYTAFTCGPTFAKDPAQQLYVNAKTYPDLESFIAAAKAAPGTLKVATEVGAYTYYETLAFQQAAGIELKIVDAGSNSEKIVAMLGGKVDLMPGSFVNCASYLEAGDFACLGVPLEAANENLPGIKTFKEQGVDFVYPDCDYSFYFPADTDAEIIKWYDDLLKVMCEDEAVAKALNELYVSPYYLNSADSAAHDGEYLKIFQDLASSVQ